MYLSSKRARLTQHFVRVPCARTYRLKSTFVHGCVQLSASIFDCPYLTTLPADNRKSNLHESDAPVHVARRVHVRANSISKQNVW